METRDQRLAVGRVMPQVTLGLGVGLGVNAATPACWASTGGQMVKLPVRQSTARSSSAGTRSQPSRHPVIAKYFGEAVHHDGVAGCLPRMRFPVHPDTPVRGRPRH